MTYPDFPSIRELRAASVTKRTTIANDFRNRARRLNDATKAYISIVPDEDDVSSFQEQPEDGKGPLAGVPFSCKDVFMTKGLLTTAGSRLLSDYIPDEDATVITRLRRAGARLVGKTNMHEFCYGITGVNPTYGTPANPFDGSRIAGGSSSGSAVSVATGSATFSIGSDTGGSVRVPAALCGLVGFKPTYGLVGTEGMIPFCWTLDHVGVITRSCLDAAPVLEVLAAWDDQRASPEASRLEDKFVTRQADVLPGLKIGVPRRYFFEKVDFEVRAATEDFLRRCQQQGAQLVELDTPDMSHIRPASLAIQLVEALSWHGPRMKAGGHLYGDDVRRGLVQGQFILAEHYVQSLRLMELKRREFAALLRRVDVLVTPATPIIAPFLGQPSISIDNEDELVGNALTRFTCVFNLTGNPALTIPCGSHSTGLPIGIQIIGKPYQDAKLLEIGHALEITNAAGWTGPLLSV